MKEIKFNRVIQIIYPFFVYYILYNLIYGLLSVIFAERFPSIAYLLIAGIVTLVPIFIIYINVPKIVSDVHFSATFLLYIFFTIVLTLGLNVLITHTGLLAQSENFAKASTILTSGTLILKIFCNCIVIPILEEILYRGIILGQLYYMTNPYLAIVISAFCFGISHFNIVQFLYAFIIGLALGLSYIKTRNLWVVIIIHSLSNLLVIIFS